MKIQILGPGCPSCHKLFELTKQAVKELNIKEEVEYTDDIKKIIEMGVMQTPILAVDGKPVLTGAVSDIEKIKSALTGKRVSDGEGNNSGCSCGGKC
jgi:small redox-active disulfide protein 2